MLTKNNIKCYLESNLIFTWNMFVKLVRKSAKINDETYTHMYRLRTKRQTANMFFYCSSGCPEHIDIGGLLSSWNSHSILNPYTPLHVGEGVVC